MTDTSGAGDDRLGAVELLAGTGGGGGLVRTVWTVAVVVIEKTSRNCLGLVETREHPVRPNLVGGLELRVKSQDPTI